MSIDLNLTAAWRIGELLFFAGFGWAILKGVRKDLNGLGKKVREEHRIEEQRFLASSLMLLVQEESKAERWKIAETILGANRHGA